MTPPNTISDAERYVMNTLWELQRATVREIRRHLEASGRAWAHTTVNTLLSRLEQKGLVARDTSTFAHIYTPAASREALVQQRLDDLANEFCNGQSVPLMLALVENQRFTEAEIEQFRQLIDRLARKAPPSRRGKRKSSDSSE